MLSAFRPKSKEELRNAVELYSSDKQAGIEKFGLIQQWDVKHVKDISELFKGLEDFNEPIGAWNVSQVTDMRDMFAGAYSFNQDISRWNVSQVRDISGMFTGVTLTSNDYKPKFVSEIARS